MGAKLGLFNEEEQDEALIYELLDLMEKYRADYTNTFRALTINKLENMALFESNEFQEWDGKWQARLNHQKQSKTEVLQLMKVSNPSVIPRNHRVEEALEAAEKGDLSVMEKLLKVLADPYAYVPEQEDYCSLPEPTDRPYRTFCGT
ncbi:hypothetical protein RhiirA1_483263 [Rhizophagus irregularis]|uniref:Selenoprotein O n=1 Tax=Rhizophagus irregularis TaxID=588596 RepID=A0A2N0QKT0_9GLOM|nr:hypothetical protein RhiirA1_483263 [Rhizophagus irregularis]